MLSDLEKSNLYHQLATMLKAGLSFEKTLLSLSDQPLSKKEKRLVQELQNGLAKNKTISESITSTKNITQLEVAMSEAGEKSGKLPSVFAQLSEYYQLLHKTKKKISTSLIYPVLILHIAILLPALPKLIASPSNATGLIIKTLLFILLFWALLIGLYFLTLQLLKIAKTNPPLDSLLNRIPFLGKTRKLLALNRFTSVTRMQLLAGQLTSTSLRTAGKASNSGNLLEASKQSAEKIENGSTLLQAFNENSAYPKEFRRSISTSEEVGNLDNEMERWSTIYRERADRSAQNAAEWIPKIFFFIICLFVAWIIISFYKERMGVVTELLNQM